MLIQQANSFGYYYFDIETVPLEEHFHNEQASFDPSKSKIITIQYQPLDIKNGEAIGDLTILKEWLSSSSERKIVEQFKRIFIDNGIWGFIPVGNNLLFECRFMKYKLKQYCNLDGLFLGHRPMIDLKHILIIMNRGKFKGCAELIGKSGRARNMLQWYVRQDYSEIEKYVIEEAKDFISVYSFLKNLLPNFRGQILSRDTSCT